MKPTIGRIVIYKTTEGDRTMMKAAGLLHGGCNVSEYLPAVIVAVWSEVCVNLKLIVDGNLELWITSSLQGENDMEWSWPDKAA